MSDKPVIWYEKTASGKRTGRTFAFLKREGFLSLGISRCSPKDQFARKIGRQIAVGRAEKVAEKVEENRKHLTSGSGDGDVFFPNQGRRKSQDDVQEILCFAVPFPFKTDTYVGSFRRKLAALPQNLLYKKEGELKKKKKKKKG